MGLKKIEAAMVAAAVMAVGTGGYVMYGVFTAPDGGDLVQVEATDQENALDLTKRWLNDGGARKDEMKRFYSIIKPMEIEYKNRLIKEMKQKKGRKTSKKTRRVL